jgi:NodT family efflux transporter outer membrane factor (OMF) lipoprotein
MINHLRNAAVFSLAACAGCLNMPSVGPDYVEPEIEVPACALPDAGAPVAELSETCEYRSADTNEDLRVEVSEDLMARWWERLNDPVLSGLVESAVSNNLSFKATVSRLEQANWELIGSFSAFSPKASIDGSVTRSETHRNNRSVQGAYRHRELDVMSGGFNASWEIDIFGGNRRASEAALAQAEAAGWGVVQAWIELTTSIGRTYVSLRTIQERIAVARNNLVLQSETYDILKSRLDSGIGDELAVNQSAYSVETTRANIPVLLAQEESLKNALAILAGTTPGALHEMLTPVSGRDWLMTPQKVAELPVDLIRSRPDVKSAERALAAQVARVGVAKSAWYPKLHITGGLGLESVHASKFVQPGSFYASIGPSVTWPLLQGGNVYAQTKIAEARVEEARLNYELAIDKAYAEVRDVYAAYTLEQHRYMALEGAVKAATDAVAISQDLYKNGLRDFNNVLDAQRSRLNLEEELAVSRGQITIDLIDLYRSLGGGLAADETGEE